MTEKKAEMCVTVDDNSDDYKLWSEHCIDNEIVIPLSQLLVST